MSSLAALRQQIKDLLVAKNGDLKISDHPDMIRDATNLGMGRAELTRMISTVNASIDWKVYDVINDKLQEFIKDGIVTDTEVTVIAAEVEKTLERTQVVRYLIEKLRNLGLEPRESFPLDWNSFKNPWMTDIAWKKAQETQVTWLGDTATSLHRMGEIAFSKMQEAKYYIRNTSYLPPLITAISRNPAVADEFSKIIDGEPDIEKRYLRVLYRLNPFLPFRFSDKEYLNIQELLNDGCVNSPRFSELFDMYKKGLIQIWLFETAPDLLQYVNADRGYRSFLSFLYNINSGLPFYIEDRKYDFPIALVDDARSGPDNWARIAEAWHSGYLQTWFEALGSQHWIQQIADSCQKAAQSGFYDDSDLKKQTVQAMILAIDSSSGNPVIEIDMKQLELLNLEASTPVSVSITVSLVIGEFVKVRCYLDKQIPGITLNKKSISFHSLEGHRTATVKLQVEPLLLIKNQNYEMDIVLESLIEPTTIPLRVKTVFPRKSVLVKMLIYATCAMLLFGLVRYSFTFFLSRGSDLSLSKYFGTETRIDTLPTNSVFMPLPFLILLFAIFYSIPILKRIEKL